MYKVMCSVGNHDDAFSETLEAEFSGVEHETREEAKQELDEALEHPAVYSAWIAEEEEEHNAFSEWLTDGKKGGAAQLLTTYAK